jgi:penicillin-binding protein 1A
MNYGKTDLVTNKKKKSNVEKRRKKGLSLLLLKALLVFILVLVCGGIFGAYTFVRGLIKELPDVSKINITPSGYSSTVYNASGSEIETLASSGANRVYVSLNDIPKNLQNAFIAIEDSRFREHNGVDLRGIMRAGFTGIMSGGNFSQGASTITQQLLKNNFFTGWTEEKTTADKIKRKIQEQYLAVQLEKVTTKDEILENYLNTINLGQNTLGVEAAAYRYFNKDVGDLTLSEDAVIAAITQNPSGNNPLSHPEKNALRREKVLKNMLKQGMISKKQYNEAINDDVYSRIKSANSIISADSTTSYFVDALTDEIVDDLVDAGYTETQAFQKLYAGGLSIYSTQDPKIQSICDEEVNNQANYPSAPQISFSYRLTVKKADGTTKNYSEQTMLAYYKKKTNNKDYNIDYPNQEAAQAAINQYKSEIIGDGDTIPEGGETVTFTLQPQVACTVMDQSNGHVVAQVGGRGEKTGSKTLNRATNVTRQPGSTFKILTVYAPALDSAGMTLASVEDDAPYSYTNGKEIKNASHTYNGYTTFRQGIYDSINIVAVKAISEIGTGLGFQYAEDFGISTLESGDNNQALAIGGISKGVKNVELTAAYATIANHGKYHEPIYYTKVLDHDGTVLLDNTEKEQTDKKVLKESTAWLLTSAMQDVMTVGTGTKAAFPGMHIAGKTGTTNDAKDSLMLGFTPYYTCGLWGGYDDNANQGATVYTKNIWKAIMSRTHEGLADKDFTQPQGITTAVVCKKSGKRPVEGLCNADPRGDMTYTEYFAEGTEPSETDTCDRHVLVNICNASGMIASPFCPTNQITSSVKILDGSANTPDASCAISSDQLNQICTVHTSSAASSLLDHLNAGSGAISP